MSDGFLAAIIFVIALVLGFAMGGMKQGQLIKEAFQECIAHQEWCVEHYQLEEGK